MQLTPCESLWDWLSERNAYVTSLLTRKKVRLLATGASGHPAENEADRTSATCRRSEGSTAAMVKE